MHQSARVGAQEFQRVDRVRDVDRGVPSQLLSGARDFLAVSWCKAVHHEDGIACIVERLDPDFVHAAGDAITAVAHDHDRSFARHILGHQ